MHVCLFDIDGTLISSGGAGKAALERAMVAEFGVAHLIEKLQLSGRPDRAIILDLFRAHSIDDVPENWQRLTASYLRHPGLPYHSPGTSPSWDRCAARRTAPPQLFGRAADGQHSRGSEGKTR